MRIEEIRPEEEHRLDLLLIRTMSNYSWYYRTIFLYYNPHLDILNMVAGTYVWIPESEDMSAVRDFRGNYSLVK